MEVQSGIFRANNMLLENDQFISRLTLMFDKSRSKGHVSLSMKRYDGRTKPVPKPRKANSKKKGRQQQQQVSLREKEVETSSGV